ncbi:MAG: SLC13 family permease [Termitinemataceae bacterium]|nr:MAG: SLC13 family permease [Termitinemataceae bacterium]
MPDIKWVILGLVVLMYAFVIIFPQKKAIWTIAAGVIVVLLGVVTPQKAVFELVSWAILMIYVGSLAIAELFIYSKVPSRLASEIVNHSPNPGIAIVIILIITAIISAFVENVATVLLMAPIALSLCKKIKVMPTFFMIGLAVMANLEGTATLVGDPPSMIFASQANYSFNDFFVYAGKPSIFFIVQIGMLAGALFFYFLFAKSIKNKITVENDKIISMVPTVLLLLMIVLLAACSFILNDGVTMEAGITVMALAVIGVLWYKFARKESGTATWHLVKHLDWETIAFLIGIFVVVGGLEATGILGEFALYLGGLIGNNVLLGFIIIILVSIVISGFVDNVPYIIAMLPVAKALSDNMGLPNAELYEFALLVGSCLGGNLTPFGASANIVAVGILKKNDIKIGFGGWLKVGLPFTLITTTTAAIALWFIWK